MRSLGKLSLWRFIPVAREIAWLVGPLVHLTWVEARRQPALTNGFLLKGVGCQMLCGLYVPASHFRLLLYAR